MFCLFNHFIHILGNIYVANECNVLCTPLTGFDVGAAMMMGLAALKMRMSAYFGFIPYKFLVFWSFHKACGNLMIEGHAGKAAY